MSYNKEWIEKYSSNLLDQISEHVNFDANKEHVILNPYTQREKYSFCYTLSYPEAWVLDNETNFEFVAQSIFRAEEFVQFQTDIFNKLKDCYIELYYFPDQEIKQKRYPILVWTQDNAFDNIEIKLKYNLTISEMCYGSEMYDKILTNEKVTNSVTTAKKVLFKGYS